MIGWQLCLAAILLLGGVKTQQAPDTLSSLDTSMPMGFYDLVNSFQFCKLIATTGDPWICQCCPRNISDDGTWNILICDTCNYPTTTTAITNPTSSSTALSESTSTLLSTTTIDDLPTSTSVDVKTSTSYGNTTTDGPSATPPINPTTTVTTDTSTALPTTNTTPTMSTSAYSDVDTTTSNPVTTTNNTKRTTSKQATTIPGVSTSTSSTKTTTLSDLTSTTTTPTLKDVTTDKITTQPVTFTTSTSDLTTKHLTSVTTGTTLTTKPMTSTTLTTAPTVSTSSTVITSTPSTISTTKTTVTSTEKPTPTSMSSSIPTQSSLSSAPSTTQILATSLASTTVLSTTKKPSTTYTASETTTDSATSTMQTNINTSKSPQVSESSTVTTISKSSTTTEGFTTLSSNAITTTVAEDSTPNSKLITETSSRKTTGETNGPISNVPSSTSSEIPTTNTKTVTTSTTADETSTISLATSTTGKIAKSNTQMSSTSSTDKITESSSTETSSIPTSAVTVTDTSSATEGTTSTKETFNLTTPGADEIITTMETKTSGSTTPESTTDQSTVATTSSTIQAILTTDGTTAKSILQETSPSAVPVTQEISTTEIAVSTEIPSIHINWCDGPCPSGYIETERGCFIMVPEEFRQNFMSAFMWCRSEDRRDLSDQDDIMTSNMIETLKYMLRLNGIRSDIIYLNGHADKLMRKDKKAGLIHLEEISIWDNLPSEYVGLSTDIVNVTGICRMPKYCETPVCDLNAVYKMLPEKVEEVENKTIVQGSGIRLKCLYPSRDFLNIRCIDPGELMPSPTLLSCTIPADVKYEPSEKEVTGNMRIRDSCSDCYDDGTANCTAEGEGYVCNCKEGWNKFTCYKSVDLCPPQYCGPNGNCITQLDEFFCNCSTGWIGDKCDVNFKKITWGGNKTLRIISSNTIASGLLGVSSGIQISLKVLSKVITDKDPEDPQEAYQAFRSTCLTMGNLAIALFQHPDLLSSEPISCRWFFFFVHICYSLAFVFMLDEVLNVCTTIHGLHRNNWVHDNKMKKRWWLDIPARIQFPFVLVFALLWYVASQGWSKIPAQWTCFGVFKRETSNIWYPLVLFNFVSIVLCFGFAENARRTLSHRIQFWTANMHLVDVTNPYIRESIEKVRRNVPYCFLLPPFMFLNWLFLCWAADQQTDTVKFVSLLFSGCYTVLSMLQTLETSTGMSFLVLSETFYNVHSKQHIVVFLKRKILIFAVLYCFLPRDKAGRTNSS